MEDIYFDNAATTKPCAEAIEAAGESFRLFGNPSSAHDIGAKARRIVEHAAKTLAKRLGVPATEVIFTSGGTEANNMALFGICAARGGRAATVVTNNAEHPSVTETARCLSKKGITPLFIPLNEGGLVDLDALERAVTAETVLVSLMQVNNETGVLQDIETAAKLVKKRNKEAVFHVDGVQGFCKHPLDLAGVDVYTLSAHKIHGIKGAGACVIKKGVRLTPLFYGGDQQAGIRPGTENTAAIAAFAAAADTVFDRMDGDAKHVKKLRDRLISGASALDGVFVNGGNPSPYIANISFTSVKAEVLANALNERGIYVSTGTACHAHRKEANILRHYGLPPERTESALRFSFCANNTLDEVGRCVTALAELVPFLRKFSEHSASGRRRSRK